MTEGSDYDEAFADEDLGHSSGSEDAVDDKPLSATGKPAKATPAASKATAPAGATAASAAEQMEAKDQQIAELMAQLKKYIRLF